LRRALLLLPIVACAGACGSSGPEVACGPGTVAIDGACTPVVDPCGSGTMSSGDRCEPVVPPLSCGPGTHEEAGVCLRDRPHDPMLEATPWSANVHVGMTDASAIFPSIAIDSKARIFVTMQVGGTFDATVEVWASGDGGAFVRVFEAAHPIRDGVPTGADVAPSIAVDGNDRVILVWTSLSFSGQSAIWSAISTDGAPFDRAPIAITRGSFFEPPAATARVSPTGEVVAIWADPSQLLSATLSLSSTGFAAPTPANTFPAAFGNFGGQVAAGPAFDRGGRPFALVELFTLFGPSGASLSNLVAWPVEANGEAVFTAVLANTRHFSFQTKGALAADRDGRFRLLFTNAVSRRIEIFESRSDDGSSWNDPLRAFDDRRRPAADAPSLAVDEQGGLHAVWCDTRTGAWLVYSADAPPGGDFGGAVRVNEVEGFDDLAGTITPLATAIAVRSGRRYAVWADPRGGIYFSTAPEP
jgi:hypothetical protein